MGTVILNDTTAPNFSLTGLDNHTYSLNDFRGKVVVLNFWSAECPHVTRTDPLLASYLPDWDDGVVLISIASNANEPLELLERVARERGLPIVLHDPHQKVADLYGAITTPHLFVIDPRGVIRYQGAFDDVSFRQRTPTKDYLKEAVETVLLDQRPVVAQIPPYGCTIVRHAS